MTRFDTFIIVAFMCNEKSIPCSLATSLCVSKNSLKAMHFINVALSTSPAVKGSLFLPDIDSLVFCHKLNVDYHILVNDDILLIRVEVLIAH